VVEFDSQADWSVASWAESSSADLIECERRSWRIRHEFHHATRAKPQAKLARYKDNPGNAIDDLCVDCANHVENLLKTW